VATNGFPRRLKLAGEFSSEKKSTHLIPAILRLALLPVSVLVEYWWSRQSITSSVPLTTMPATTSPA
jgi:hypothetical protein